MPVAEPCGIGSGRREQEPGVLDAAAGQHERPCGHAEASASGGDHVGRRHGVTARVRLERGRSSPGDHLDTVGVLEGPVMQDGQPGLGTDLEDPVHQDAGLEVEGPVGKMWPARLDVVEPEVAEPEELLRPLVERHQLVPPDGPPAVRDPVATSRPLPCHPSTLLDGALSEGLDVYPLHKLQRKELNDPGRLGCVAGYSSEPETRYTTGHSSVVASVTLRPSAPVSVAGQPRHCDPPFHHPLYHSPRTPAGGRDAASVTSNTRTGASFPRVGE